jgi:hypothetical protein
MNHKLTYKSKTNKQFQLFTFLKMNPMKLAFHESITIYDSQLEHIWSSTLLKQCISRTTQAF